MSICKFELVDNTSYINIYLVLYSRNKDVIFDQDKHTLLDYNSIKQV